MTNKDFSTVAVPTGIESNLTLHGDNTQVLDVTGEKLGFTSLDYFFPF